MGIKYHLDKKRNGELDQVSPKECKEILELLFKVLRNIG
jgi:hypothetical protein